MTEHRTGAYAQLHWNGTNDLLIDSCILLLLSEPWCAHEQRNERRREEKERKTEKVWYRAMHPTDHLAGATGTGRDGPSRIIESKLLNCNVISSNKSLLCWFYAENCFQMRFGYCPNCFEKNWFLTSKPRVLFTKNTVGERENFFLFRFWWAQGKCEGAEERQS